MLQIGHSDTLHLNEPFGTADAAHNHHSRESREAQAEIMAHGGDVGHVAQVDNDVFQVGKGGSAVVEQFFHIEQEATCLRHYVAAVHAFAVFVNACGAREKVNALTSHTETGAALEGHAIFGRGVEVVEGLEIADVGIVRPRVGREEVGRYDGLRVVGIAADAC